MEEGIVSKSTGSWYEILTQNGATIPARIKGKFKLSGSKNTNFLAVGDYVKFSSSEEHFMIEELLPRKNYIIRKSNNLSRQTHIIAANISCVMVMATIEQPETSQGFIDRILLTAEAYQIPPIIVFNKTDLYTKEANARMLDMISMYKKAGYKSFSISLKKQTGVDKLLNFLKGKVTLVSGHSGSGKSTFLNTINPDLNIKTKVISKNTLKGKHTTTFAEMHTIDAASKTYVIDTPGIKDFGIIDFKKNEISHFFPEMKGFLGTCYFNDCIHISEPGCKVLEALEKGEINMERYNSYLSMLEGDDSHH